MPPRLSTITAGTICHSLRDYPYNPTRQSYGCHWSSTNADELMVVAEEEKATQSGDSPEVRCRAREFYVIEHPCVRIQNHRCTVRDPLHLQLDCNLHSVLSILTTLDDLRGDTSAWFIARQTRACSSTSSRTKGTTQSTWRTCLSTLSFR